MMMPRRRKLLTRPTDLSDNPTSRGIWERAGGIDKGVRISRITIFDKSTDLLHAVKYGSEQPTSLAGASSLTWDLSGLRVSKLNSLGADCHDQVLSSAPLYSGSPRLKSWPRDQLPSGKCQDSSR